MPKSKRLIHPKVGTKKKNLFLMFSDLPKKIQKNQELFLYCEKWKSYKKERTFWNHPQSRLSRLISLAKNIGVSWQDKKKRRKTKQVLILVTKGLSSSSSSECECICICCNFVLPIFVFEINYRSFELLLVFLNLLFFYRYKCGQQNLIINQNKNQQSFYQGFIFVMYPQWED